MSPNPRVDFAITAHVLHLYLLDQQTGPRNSSGIGYQSRE